eukprot:CCRYP_004846-RA/>CCRYP_004846-RA protein AED:0.12 eAED:0.12 QI:0/-1/0/1/-1/0/1/0/54
MKPTKHAVTFLVTSFKMKMEDSVIEYSRCLVIGKVKMVTKWVRLGANDEHLWIA